MNVIGLVLLTTIARATDTSAPVTPEWMPTKVVEHGHRWHVTYQVVWENAAGETKLSDPFDRIELLAEKGVLHHTETVNAAIQEARKTHTPIAFIGARWKEGVMGKEYVIWDGGESLGFDQILDTVFTPYPIDPLTDPASPFLNGVPYRIARDRESSDHGAVVALIVGTQVKTSGSSLQAYGVLNGKPIYTVDHGPLGTLYNDGPWELFWGDLSYTNDSVRPVRICDYGLLAQAATNDGSMYYVVRLTDTVDAKAVPMSEYFDAVRHCEPADVPGYDVLNELQRLELIKDWLQPEPEH